MIRLKPGHVVERYVVDAHVGAGGAADVYRVRHADLGSLHALKVVRVHTSHARERTLIEGRAQASLQHPHVVPVTDVLTLDGAPALVMPFVQGPTLYEFLLRYRPTSEEVDVLGRQILEGLAAAHDAGLIHRDLKPGNVLLERTTTGISARITDFGLAKALATPAHLQVTAPGAAFGTPAFMAPEQVRDSSRVDARADVYSAGAMLYHLATGRPVWLVDDLVALYQGAMNESYPRVLEVAPDALPRHAAAIEAALRAEPRHRPANAGELLTLWLGTERPRATATGWREAALQVVDPLARRVDALAPTRGSDHSEPATDVMQGLHGAPTDAPTEVAGAPSEWRPGSGPRSTIVRERGPTSGRSRGSMRNMNADQWLLAEAPNRRRPVAAFVTAAAVAVVLAVVVFATLWSTARSTGALRGTPRGEAGTSRVDPQEPTAIVTPGEADAPAAVVRSTVHTPPRPVASPPVPAPVPEPEPADSADQMPVPEPTRAPRNTVVVTPPTPVIPIVEVRGAERAWLVATDGRRFPPASAPPGRYDLVVFFDGVTATTALTLDVGADTRRVIQCNAAVRACR